VTRISFHREKGGSVLCVLSSTPSPINSIVFPSLLLAFSPIKWVVMAMSSAVTMESCSSTTLAGSQKWPVGEEGKKKKQKGKMHKWPVGLWLFFFFL